MKLSRPCYFSPLGLPVVRTGLLCCAMAAIASFAIAAGWTGCAALPALLADFRHDAWLGVCVGEASNPGPRNHRPKQVGLTKGDVKRLVKTMVLQLAEQFFGQPTFGAMAPEDSDYRKGKGNATNATDATPDKGKGKGKQAPKGATANDKGGSKGKNTKGKEDQDTATSPWRRWAEPRAPRGPAGGDALAMASGTTGSSTAVLEDLANSGLQSTAKGKGQQDGAGKGKSKGKGNDDGDVPAPRARRWQRDGWQQVKWKLRAGDLNFNKVITTTADLELELDKGDPVLVYTDDGTALEEFGELMRGGCHPQSLLVFDGQAGPELDALKRDFPVEHKSLPGVLRGSLKLRRCWVVAWTKGKSDVGELPLDVEVDFIEARAPKQRTVYQDSVVIRAACAQCFTDTDRWKKIVHRPGVAIRDWIARLGGSPAEILDSWAWEKTGDGVPSLHPHGVVKGLLRLSPSAARALLAAGGRCFGGVTFFCQPLRWSDLTLNQPALLWEPQRPDESPCQYLRRVVASSGDLGLYHDGKRLAVRVDPRDPRNAAKQGLWHLRQVPLGWHVLELEEVLKEVGFEEIEVQARYRDRRSARWTFMALRTDRRD